jgi:hypothetical protein
VTVEGTVFRVTLPDGRILSHDDIVGAVLTLGDGSGLQRRIRINSEERDVRDPTGEVMLYTLSEPDPITGEWRNACNPDPDGRRLGFPLAGAFTPDGRYINVPGRILITCTGEPKGSAFASATNLGALCRMAPPSNPTIRLACASCAPTTAVTVWALRATARLLTCSTGSASNGMNPLLI